MDVPFNHPDRIFTIWQYSVGMKRLLLRSTKSETFDSRIDVLFQNVKALKLPTLLHGVTVLEANSEESDRISLDTGMLAGEGSIPYVVSGIAYTGYVVAGLCVVAEDEGEYRDSSALWPDDNTMVMPCLPQGEPPTTE